MLQNDHLEVGDSFYTAKKQYPLYDLTLSNMSNRILIEVISPELKQAFFAPDKNEKFKKSPMQIKQFKESMGEGLIFSEG